MAISPEMLKMAMQLFQAKQKQQQQTGGQTQNQSQASNAWADNIAKGSKGNAAAETIAPLVPGASEFLDWTEKGREKLANNVRALPGQLSGLGNILQQTSLSEDGNANVGQSVLGGALSGVAGGAAMGPLGAILGGLMGATTGYATANQANADFYDTKAIEDKFRLSSKTVSPSIYGEGGFAVGEDELIPVQMELDETYVTPDLRILDSKADSTHEKMANDVVTDIVVNNSFVLSNRKKLKLKDYSKEVLGYGLAKYNEDGDYDLNKVTMKDGFGDSNKKVTFSEASQKLKRKYNTVRDEDKTNDVFTRITNQENKQARMPFLNKLIKLHEGEEMESQELIPNQYKYGGKVKKGKDTDYPAKYDKGGVVDILGDVLSDIDVMENKNKEDYETNQSNYNKLFNRLSVNNSLSALSSGLATGLQSSRVDPALVSTNLADQMYQEMSPAVVDQMRSNNSATTNSLIANLARTSPESATRVAPRLMDSQLRASNDISMRGLTDRLKQRRAKYSFLDRKRDYNNKELIRARQASRSLINKKRKMLNDTLTNYLSQSSQYDVDKMSVDQKNMAQFNANTQKNIQNRLNTASQLGEYEASRDYQDSQNKYMEDSLNEGRRINESTLDGIPLEQFKQRNPLQGISLDLNQ